MFSDKTEYNVTMSKVITRYLQYIQEVISIIRGQYRLNKCEFTTVKKIRHKYKKYKHERGAEIKDIIYITRDEPFPHMYENTFLSCCN